MKLKNLVITAFLAMLFLPLVLVEEIWAQEWAKAYGNGWANSVQQTSDGGYIVAGTASFSTGSSDILVIKLDTMVQAKH